MAAETWSSNVGAVAASITLFLVVIQIMISRRQTIIMNTQIEIAAAQAAIQAEQHEAIKRDRARRARLVICSPTEEDPEDERCHTLAMGAPEEGGWIRARLELYIHNYGDIEARDVTVVLYMPYELAVYEHNGHTVLPSSYEITDLAVDPENDGLYDADHQLHRIKATFSGPFYPGATLPIGFTEILAVAGMYPMKWRVYCSQGTFPPGEKLGILSVRVCD